MALPAKRIPESVAHMDMEIVAAALIRNDANVRNTAQALGVPSGDLRKLVLVDQRLADAALEAVELRLDDAEANLCEALHCNDPRRRDAVSMFMLRNTQRAAKRGYAVATSAASLEVSQASDQASAQTVVFRWGGGDSDREMDVIERDGKKLSIPRYGELGDCLEGALAESAVLIEHADTRGLEPAPGLEVEPAEQPSAIEASEPEAPVRPRPRSSPPSVTSASELTPGFAIASSPIRSPPVCSVVSRSSRARIGRRRRTARPRARFHRACHTEWRAEQEAVARQALGLEG